MRAAHYFLCILIVGTFAACAGSVERQNVESQLFEMGLELGEANSRVPRYRVSGWSSLDGDNLIITAGVNEKYLVRLRPPCINLPGAFSIGFTTPMNSLDRFSRIVIRSSGRGREYCDIEDVVRLYPIDG